MTIENSTKCLKNLIAKLEEDKDPYLFVHFSREEDKYNGLHDNMDFADAIIVIKQLMKEFHINHSALSLISNSVKN